MRAAAWNADRTLSVGERPEPEAVPGASIVRVLACGICGSDLHFFRGEWPPTAGRVPGHEFAGEVVTGERFPAGTRVAVEPVVSCGACRGCLRGHQSVCANLKLIGIGLDGGMQQLVAVPNQCLHPLPPSIDPMLGSMAEPLAVAVRGLNVGEVPAGARVLVLGAGTIGLVSALLVRERAAEVAITARYEHQRDLAVKLGVVPFEPESKPLRDWLRDRRPDVVIETVGGLANTLAEAIHCARPGGTVVALGVFTGNVEVPAFRIVNQEIRVIGSVVYGHSAAGSEFGAAVALLPRYRDELSLLQRHSFPLAQANEAFEAATSKRDGAIKVTVLPGE